MEEEVEEDRNTLSSISIQEKKINKYNLHATCLCKFIYCVFYFRHLRLLRGHFHVIFYFSSLLLLLLLLIYLSMLRLLFRLKRANNLCMI